MSGFEDGFPYSTDHLQFRDQVDQFDHEQAQEEYREQLEATPVYLRPGYVREMDEDEAIEAEREMDCE